jgi:hypothetical protein
VDVTASAKEIRQAIVDRLLANQLVASAFPYEPENLGPLPCATMILAHIDPEEVATGPRVDVTWYLELRLYVGLSDWAAAQEQLDDLVPVVIGVFRDDPTLDHLIEWFRLLDTGVPVEFNAGERWLRKTLQVAAKVESV